MTHQTIDRRRTLSLPLPRLRTLPALAWTAPRAAGRHVDHVCETPHDPGAASRFGRGRRWRTAARRRGDCVRAGCCVCSAVGAARAAPRDAGWRGVVRCVFGARVR